MRSRNMQRVPLGDEEIVALYWARNEDAIKETDYKYKSYLLTVAQRILDNAFDSEECLNDTYVGAWNAIPPQRPRILQAFLATIMRRIAVNRYKANKRQKRVVSEFSVSMSELEELLPYGEDVNSRIDAGLLGKLISDFVRGLPERQMYIFMGRYYFSKPIAELARSLGCSESTVHKEIAAIKRGLKEKLEREGYEI